MRGTFIVALGLAVTLAIGLIMTAAPPTRGDSQLHELAWTAIPLAMLAVLAAAVLGHG